MSHSILSLEELRALPGPVEYDSGIYFLWKGQDLLYIGRSRNLCSREYYQATVNRYYPFHHSQTAKYIPADRMTCLVLENGIECSRELDSNLSTYERAYIAAYEPPYNYDNGSGFT
jgi:hypothetical protein